jgi:chromosome segregation protein
MFLKSLTMKGFKSFADPTVLDFEPGLTVVVGPNGSGKSNVVDAVTWVLGAQGPRSLRSQKMEDVIFAGTTSRPALGRAEVSLTIDNSSGRLPVDMAEVTITRTLFRSGDSEYAVNGTPCRLLDIQDLLNDSGVGRQQHMIIGQNQLDAVLTARPEDRRAVIEEAAGVLKHRRRRERAERRLEATQVNLERLGDLVRELRRQIRPLERQATAARSHAAVAAELRELRVHLAGAELTDLSARRARAARSLDELADDDRVLRDRLESLDAESAAATAELSSGRDEHLASALARVQALVERARGMSNVLRERSRALDAALDAAADGDVVSTLETEGARLVAELSATRDAEAALDPERARLEAAMAELASSEASHRGMWAGADHDHEAAADALADAVRGLEGLRQTLEHDRRTLASVDHLLAASTERLGVLDARLRTLDGHLEGLGREGAHLSAELEAAARAHADGRRAADEAEQAARTADQERHRSAARAEALGRALRELEGAGGRELLNDVDGVVGSLVDLVEIDPGWEEAFEAAAGASVAAVVVSGREAAAEALSRLHRLGATGSLLVAPVRAAGAHQLPSGALPVRPHVRPRRPGAGEGVDAVLDALVGRAVRVEGWERALDLALDRPDLVVVTADGDRFADSGWRVRSSRGVVTAAAVEEAEARAVAAAERAESAAARHREARDSLDELALVATAAARAQDRHDAARAAAVQERSRLEEDMERMAAELDDARRDRETSAARVAADEQALAALERSLPAARASVEAAAERAARAGDAQAALDARRGELAAACHALEVRAAGLEERRRVLTSRLAEVERRLEGRGDEREVAANRRRRLEEEGAALGRLGDVVAREARKLDAMLLALRSAYSDQAARIREGAARVAALRDERAELERRQASVRDRVRDLDREVAEASLRIESLEQTVTSELGVSPSEAREASEPPLPDGVTAAAHAASLATRLASLGPVNPLALDELSVLEERHRELDTQMEDVRSARRKLHDVVRDLDREIAEQFASAAADVSDHFSTFVGLLFPGGTGRLSLTDPGDLLNTGVEIEVRPAGRNVRRVSLLSGGERSMAALAFLFAIFRSRPSPFYLMDEVEAALDDVNLHRFLGLVHEFRVDAQLIVVSHQKRTMEAADALYGVTMAPGGSSQVVSQRASRHREAQPVP